MWIHVLFFQTVLWFFNRRKNSLSLPSPGELPLPDHGPIFSADRDGAKDAPVPWHGCPVTPCNGCWLARGVIHGYTIIYLPSFIYFIYWGWWSSMVLICSDVIRYDSILANFWLRVESASTDLQYHCIFRSVYVDRGALVWTLQCRLRSHVDSGSSIGEIASSGQLCLKFWLHQFMWPWL